MSDLRDPDVSQLVREALRADPSRPLLTFYDDATGERTELSVATTANWVAKAANLLVTDLELEAGDQLGLALPAHWQTCVWQLASWACGVQVVDLGEDGDSRTPPAGLAAVVLGPSALAGASGAGRWQVLVTALAPLNVPAPEPLLAGAHDADRALISQPDAAPPLAPPEPAALLLTTAEGQELTLAQVRSAAATAPAARLLTDRSPLRPEVAGHLLGSLAGGGSLVICRHLDPGRVQQRSADERADVVLTEAPRS